LPEFTKAWTTFQGDARLRPIRDEADLARMHAFADFLADSVGDDENPLCIPYSELP
jgi:hypothetical protein